MIPERDTIIHRTSSAKLKLEPKVMQLLLVLAESAVHVVSREEIINRLWADVVVGEDTLARTVSRLRSALGDRASEPRYIETVPKKGYRLLGKPTNLNKRRQIRPALIILSFVLIFSAVGWGFLKFRQSQEPSQQSLLNRANDYYMNFTLADNEAAIELYRKVLAQDDNNVEAQSGLANSMVQRVIRWPHLVNIDAGGQDSLAKALRSGQLRTPEAKHVLEKAVTFAERAVRLAPDDTASLKALGLTYSASGKLSDAERVYRRALTIDPLEWRSMINLGEIYLIREQTQAAVDMFESAYTAMQQAYTDEPQNIGPWQPAVGVLVGKLHDQLGHPEVAERWYRKVLEVSPFNAEATTRLSYLLRSAGNHQEAEVLCQTLSTRTGQVGVCSDN